MPIIIGYLNEKLAIKIRQRTPFRWVPFQRCWPWQGTPSASLFVTIYPVFAGFNGH